MLPESEYMVDKDIIKEPKRNVYEKWRYKGGNHRAVQCLYEHRQKWNSAVCSGVTTVSVKFMMVT